MAYNKKIAEPVTTTHADLEGPDGAVGDGPVHRNKKRSHTLVIGYDPAKDADGGLAALYDGKLIWCDKVMIWDLEEEYDLCAGFENIRNHWMEQDNDIPSLTKPWLFYEKAPGRNKRLIHAISEAGGAAFPYFSGYICNIFEVDEDTLEERRAVKQRAKDYALKHAKSVYPNAWFNATAAKYMKGDDRKAASMKYAYEKFGYKGGDHNVADAICIADYGYLSIS